MMCWAAGKYKNFQRHTKTSKNMQILSPALYTHTLLKCMTLSLLQHCLQLTPGTCACESFGCSCSGVFVRVFVFLPPTKPPHHTAIPPHHTAIPPHHTVIPPRHTAIPPHHTVIPPRHTVIPPRHTVVPPRHTVIPRMSLLSLV